MANPTITYLRNDVTLEDNATSELWKHGTLSVKMLEEYAMLDQVTPVEILADLTPIQGPTFDQYIGPWFMLEDHFMTQVRMIQSHDLSGHIINQQALKEGAKQEHGKSFDVVRGNIARIDIEGTMTKRGSSFGGRGTIFARRQIRLANADPDVDGVFLRIDSPGGTAAGTKDLADDIFNVAKNKPVLTFFEDTGASAAFYAGSQATIVKANASAIIGSIGSVLVVIDMSEMAKEQGIKVHVISTGAFKGAGVPGTEITEDQIAYFQDVVNKGNELFLEDVARGRKNLNLTQVRQLADGRVHLAADAVKLGLIDGISTLDEALDELVSLTTSNRRNVTMSENIGHVEVAELRPQEATLSELQTAFPNASADFFVKQLEKRATIEQAMCANNAQLQADLTAATLVAEAAKEETAVAKQEAADALKKMPGNSPDIASETIEGETTVWADAGAKWKDLIQQAQDPKQNGMDRKAAVVKVDIDNPGLREQMLKEWKPQPKQKSQPPV